MLQPPLFGAITVDMPRDRASGWHSYLPKYGRSLPVFDDMIIRLYKTGLSFMETALLNVLTHRLTVFRRH